jgi:hypothetical protein
MRWYTSTWAMISSSHLLVIMIASSFHSDLHKISWYSSLNDRWGNKMLDANKSLTGIIYSYYPDGYSFFICKEQWRLHPQYTTNVGTSNTRHFVETDARSSGHRLQPRHETSSRNRKWYASITEMSQSVMCDVHDTPHWEGHWCCQSHTQFSVILCGLVKSALISLVNLKSTHLSIMSMEMSAEAAT